MLKLNSDDEAELYRDWNGSTYGRSGFADPENKQMDCLNTLEEKISLFSALEDQWQEKLLRADAMLDSAKMRMQRLYGVVGVLTGFSLLIMILVVILKLDSEYVMLASGGILLLFLGASLFIYLAVEATCFYGVHNEWKPFQKYNRRYQVVSLKSEIEGLIKGIQYMKEQCGKAEEFKARLKKGQWLSEEEYQWASARPEPPYCPAHSENLAKNLWKKKSE